MTVTEFAVLPMLSEEDLPEGTRSLPVLMQEAQEAQARWRIQNLGETAEEQEANRTRVWQQVEDKSVILLTARWDTPESHWRWIASPPNMAVVQEIKEHLVPVEDGNKVLFHVDADVFEAPGVDTLQGLYSCAVLSVDRMVIKPGRRHEFEPRFSGVRDILDDFVRPDVVRGGWRIEKEDESKDEFLLFCGWPALQPKPRISEEFESKYAALMELVEQIEITHYMAVMED